MKVTDGKLFTLSTGRVNPINAGAAGSDGTLAIKTRWRPSQSC